MRRFTWMAWLGSASWALAQSGAALPSRPPLPTSAEVAPPPIMPVAFPVQPSMQPVAFPVQPVMQPIPNYVAPPPIMVIPAPPPPQPAPAVLPVAVSVAAEVPLFPDEPVPPPVKKILTTATTPAIATLPPLPHVPGVPSAGPVEQPIVQAQAQTIAPATPITPYYPERTFGDNYTTVPQPSYHPQTETLPYGEGYLPAARSPQVWFEAEYLFWYAKSASAPPLVQSVPTAGVYDPASATTLSPSGGFNDNPIQGYRGTAGFWIDQSKSVGIEGSYTKLMEANTSDTYTGTASAVLARPFNNVVSGRPAGYQLLSTGTNQSTSTVETSLNYEAGNAELLLRPDWLASGIVGLVGFKYASLSESLQVVDRTTNAANNLSLTAIDRFTTQNRFFGGQIGARFLVEDDRWQVSATARIAVGGMEETTRISGQTNLSANGIAAQQFVGNVLATSSNIGGYSRTQLSVIPQGSLNIGYRWTPNITTFIGYDITYLSEAVRPGGQIDTGVNPGQIPLAGAANTAPRRPEYQFRGEEFWIMGANVGLAIRY